LLELVGEPLRSVEGDFELAVNVDRQEGQSIELSGTASVADAALDIGLPIGVTQTDGRFVLQGSSVRIDRLAGRSGGGTFSVEGGVDLEQGPDIGWKIVELGGSLLPSLEQELSGQGTLQGAWNDLTVAGEIEILRLLYDRNIEPRDFIPSFKRRLAPVNGERSANVVRLDLRVHAPDDLHVDNNFARVEAMADLRVRGTTEQPKVGGRIDVLTGEVFFRDRTFDIVTGVVDFRPQRNLVADLNITAETVIDTADTSYGITVQVSGTTDDPKVILSADDSGLTQTDIVSLITFGKTVAQLQQSSGGGGSMDALLGFAAGKVTGGVEREAESLLGVDRVEIAPSFSTSGTFEPQVKISKDLNDDLSASVATSLGVSLQRSVNLDYHLTDRTSLFGTWESESEGQAGAFGGGVKFRREFRRIPGFSLLGSTEK
jgi:autotransporter translocation and assembly factor TamB